MNSAGEKVAIAHFYRVHTYGHFRKRYSKAVANLCKQTGLIRSCNDNRHKLYTLFFCDIRPPRLKNIKLTKHGFAILPWSFADSFISLILREE